MKIHNGKTKLSMVALAVASVLNATPARADDAEAQALMKPTSTAELGLHNVSQSSAKFGEYNGLNKSGAYGYGNLNIRGGDAYDNQGGTSRWSIIGTDLGLTTQSLGATYSNQGQWKLGFGYDELRHNLSDTYQTPYVGSMGGNNFALPTGFGLVAVTPGTVPGTTALSAAQQAAFQTMDIATIRKNTSLNGDLALSARWNLNFDINHLDQTGAKLMGFGSALLGGAVNETVSILPMPTNYTTDTLKLGVSWKGDKEHLAAGYNGSFFRDGYDRMTVQTWAGANVTQTIGTAPANDFHQLSLTGGYAFTPKTKLAGSVSTGRNTQNDAYVYDPGMMVTPAPRSSSNGLVETTHADLKLTDQTTAKLILGAGFKYDVRENKTDSNIYNFNAISGSAGNIANYPNTPRSYSKTKYELSGDYRLEKDRHVRLDYEGESIKRWCDQYAVNAGYPAGTNCVVAGKSQENKFGATYVAKAGESVGYRVNYSYADRNTDSDPFARTAFISTNGGVPLGTVAPAGQNGGDFYGFSPAFDASRTQQIVRANVNWEATEKLTFGVGGRYTDDKYRSTFGEQQGNTWSASLDVNYAHSEDFLITSYLTQQHRQRQMTDIQATAAVTATATVLARPANATWSDTLMDDDTTFGLGARQKGLMGGKLELTADLTYSLANLGYNTTLNYNAATTTPGLNCASPQFQSCGNLPTINSEMTQVKLAGFYTVNKSSKVMMRYTFQQLNATDYYYNGYQMGNTPSTLMPTNQQPGAYVVNVITLAYAYNF